MRGPGGMEHDGCCCRGEAGARRPHEIHLLRSPKEARLKRLAPCVVAALLLLISAALALLLAVVLAGRGHQPNSHSSGVGFKQQPLNDDRNPSAMLTAPKGNNTDGAYLKWESETDNAFCQGGFNYSSGNLVVPRNGHYRVFLQITYESKEGLKCPSDDGLRLLNRVYLIRDTYKSDVCLLSSVDTVSCSMEQWSKSLYTAGLFFLEANCILHVTSSHPELIAKNQHQVFFGAELLRQ